MKQADSYVRVSVESVHDLPDTPGVYLFYHHDESQPVYIGKSIHIKQRVMSHFQAAHHHGKAFKITHFCRSVAYFEMAGELGALLLESRLIKQYRPRFNRRLIACKRLSTITLDSINGCLVPKVVHQEPLNFHPNSCHYGYFRGGSSANRYLEQLCDQKGFCRKILGLESGGGPCFAYQLKRCQGACVDNAKLESQNHALKKYLRANQLRSWPYDGQIIIKEQGLNFIDSHVINNWRHIKTDRKGDDVMSGCILKSNDGSFDYDVYMILSAFMKRQDCSHQLAPISA